MHAVVRQFLPTLLSNDSNFVALGGDPQRMHIENLTASMHMQPVSAAPTPLLHSAARRTARSPPHTLFPCSVRCAQFGYAQQFVEEDVSVTSSVRAALGRLLPGISLAEVPINMSESTEPRITPIAILFGVAADPLSPDVAQAVLSNSSAREYGAARCIADVVVPDIISSNGVLHVIDRMLLLPMNLSFVLFKANKTAFLTALNDSGVLDEIEALENITVLAPTNAAWEAATARLRLNASTGNSTQFGEGGGLNESDARETLRTVLLMHVINGSFYPTDLSERRQSSAQVRGGQQLHGVRAGRQPHHQRVARHQEGHPAQERSAEPRICRINRRGLIARAHPARRARARACQG